MANPFEDEVGNYLVLANSQEQYSLWPARLPVPDGWRTVHGVDTRAACLAYVEEVWTDMRPAGLRDAAQQAAG
uniref:MbtH family protein n=1 Tax=Mangrovihabitans endophyticus TaxID=1751298 RepID=UPI0027B929BB|nr:MbtH family protein [Mangrovihabitans endophyticus]